MGSSLLTPGPPLYVALVVLTVIAAAVTWTSGTRLWRQVPWAAVRAAAQLLALAALLVVIVGRPWAVVAFIAMMAWVAAWTADGRISAGSPRHDPRMEGRVDRHVDSAAAVAPSPADDPSATERDVRRAELRARIVRTFWTTLPVAAFAVAMTAALAVAGVVPPEGIAIIPTAGIFIGNGMTVTSLTGRRCHDELRARLGEVEAAIALGFEERRARLHVLRDAALTAFGPTIDATRTVGMVTIPGAFVGMILGGASLVDAAVMQLFVMLGILAVAAVANAAVMRLVAAGRM
ncbi:ABC transporter permease [Corynebacterium sp. 335C]